MKQHSLIATKFFIKYHKSHKKNEKSLNLVVKFPTNRQWKDIMQAVNIAPNLTNLAQQLNQTRQIPPLEKWQPQFCGQMNLTIKTNGEWWHEGQKMTRQSLIDLFAKVLWAEIQDDNSIHYFLKTPVEKCQIIVEDAPLHLIAVDKIWQDNQPYLVFTTSQGDKVTLDKEHPIRFGLPFHTHAETLQKQQHQPYLLVRTNGNSVLYGLIQRSVFFHLIDLGELVETEQSVELRLQSGHDTFVLSMGNEIL